MTSPNMATTATSDCGHTSLEREFLEVLEQLVANIDEAFPPSVFGGANEGRDLRAARAAIAKAKEPARAPELLAENERLETLARDNFDKALTAMEEVERLRDALIDAEVRLRSVGLVEAANEARRALEQEGR